MPSPNIVYSSLLLFAGITCLVVAVVVWQQSRTAPGATSLIVMMLALTWWDVTYAIFWAGAPGPTPFFWLDITYVGVVAVPPAFLAFALQFAKQEHWLKRPIVLALAVEPLFVLIMLWTDPLHGLFFAGKRALNTGMILEAGPVFWANIGYSYLLVLIAYILLVRRFFRSSGLYRQQAVLVLAGVAITLLSNLIFLFGFNPLPNADNTPFTFSLTALAFAYAVLRYRLLDVVPIARDVLIDIMSEGVIVLDTQHRIVDINRTAQAFFGAQTQSPIGKPIDQVFTSWRDIVTQIDNIHTTHAEITISESPTKCLDLRISPLLDRRHRYVGRLIVWRDITDLINAQAKLIELATTDELTQVFNRRHFLERAEHELKRARRFQQHLTVVIADIDLFKHVNDRYGHPAGDQVLIAYADICRKNIRETDIFARFGGEEFIMLMPATDSEQAYQIIERLRIALTQIAFPIGSQTISITSSFGIATLKNETDTLEAILQRADQALYTAKQSGRNRAIIG